MRPAAKKDGALERITVGKRKYVRLPLNSRKTTQWNGIRAWKRRNRAIHNLGNVYEASTLIGQVQADRVRPFLCDEFGILKPIRALLLGWVTLACKVRKAYALRCNRAQWSFLLHCHPNTFDAHREYLVSEGWLKVIRDYRPGAFKGRDGRYRHRQMANWYAPGWRLDQAWERLAANRSRLVEPIREQAAPSANEPDRNCDPFVPHCEKQNLTRVPRAKESPSETAVVEKPTSSATGADGPVKESPSETAVVEKPTSSATGADGPVKVSAPPTKNLKPPAGAADQGAIASPGPARTGTPPDSGPAAVEHRTENDCEEVIGLIAQLPISRSEQRDLVIQYRRYPLMVGASIRAWATGRRR